MKRQLFKLSLFAIAMAFLGSVMAQEQTQLPHGEKSANTPMKINPSLNSMESMEEVLFYEDWSGGDFGDWTIDGEGSENWTISATNQCGGEAPEAQMYYSPIFLGASRLVSPVINTTGNSELALSFLHVLDLWSGGGGFWVSVETTSDGGATWDEVWEIYWETTDDYYAFEIITIANDDVGSEDFQFCFKYEDNSDLLDWWKIDNITLGEFAPYDVAAMTIGGIDGTWYEGDPITVNGDIKNLGSETVTFDVMLEISDGSGVVYDNTQTVTDLASTETVNVTFDAWTAFEGVYTATITTMLADDSNPDNDAISGDFVVFSSEYYCIPAANCDFGDGLEDFAFAGIENFASGCSAGGYGNYTGMTAEVEIGYTYIATISTNYSTQMVSIWVDFNKDFEFTSDELILTDHLLEEAGVLYAVDITIPAGAEAGSTYMRVGANWIDPSSPDPCATLTYGEWEDYSIDVSGVAISYNAGVESINMGTYVAQGDITPMATVVNLGVETVSFPVTCTIEGGYSSTVQVTDLAYNESLDVEFDVWAATPGSYVVEVETELSGDEIPDNDMKSQTVGVVSYLPEKRVVGEEGTGTWCGWCVRGIVWMEYMAETYPETWIGIGVHNGDPMVVPEYDDGIGFTAFPSGLVDRTLDVDPSAFEEAYLAQMAEIATGTIEVTAKSFDEETGELTFTLTSDFVVDVTDHKFSAVLLENYVTGTGPSWAQANYYSGGGYGPMGGFEDLPNPVPAEDMIYMDVARALLGPIGGVDGSLPASVLSGESHSYEFTTTVGEDWNMENVEIVGMLLDVAEGGVGRIVNGVKVHALGTVGTDDVQVANNDLVVYPNPASDNVNIKSSSTIKNVWVYNHIGQLVYESAGNSKVMNFNTSDLKTGLYMFKVETEEGLQVKSVIVE